MIDKASFAVANGKRVSAVNKNRSKNRYKDSNDDAELKTTKNIQ
jgi:hypothetical protein